MTAGDALRMLRRRWYVVAVGLLLTAIAMGVVYERAGVYGARTNVVLLAPQSHRNPNQLTATSNALIATAGVVEQYLNRGHDPILPVSPDIPLVDQGVRSGWRVFVPNYGGQWAVNYERATLIVDVVGPSPAAVTAQTEDLVRRIQNELQTLQDQQGVTSYNLISGQPSPATPVVVYATGRPKIAVLATMALGAGLTVVAAWAADGLLGRRRRTSPIGARATGVTV